MKPLKIAVTADARKFLKNFSERDIVSFEETDFTDVAAVVVTSANSAVSEAVAAFGIPVILAGDGNKDTARRIENAAAAYEASLLPPFFRELCAYAERGNAQFDCPGHQGGAFHRRHPAGRAFYEFFGENLFRADLCNADVALGDLLIHEGPALAAQQYAARVFGADKTYFVLNGTSAANKVVTGALLTPGDLVLFDRNNHKSVAQGALLLAGATPVYLETARNPYGSIGGIPAACLEEDFIRGEIAKVCPEKAKAARPIRLAAIQLGTYDGCLHAIGAQAAGRFLASLADSQKRRALQGECALCAARPRERFVYAARVHIALLSAFCRAFRQCENAGRESGRDAVERGISAGDRNAKGHALPSALYAPLRAARRARTKMGSGGNGCHRARCGVLGAVAEGNLARIFRLRRRTIPHRSDETLGRDKRHRCCDGCVRKFRAPRRGLGGIFARERHYPGEKRFA